MLIDVDLRKLRYFVAVAECEGFRRAAERLRVAQPALTRQIRSFEADMQAELFTRSSRGVVLTEAGMQLLDDAETLLASANEMRRRLVELKTRAPRLAVGFAEGIPIASVVRQFGRLYPHVEVDLVSVPEGDQIEQTLTGRVDVCFARGPMESLELEVSALFEEPCVVAMPSDEPLSRVDFLELRDLAAFRLLQDPEQVPELAAVASSLRRTPTPGVVARKFSPSTTEEALEHVAAHHGIVILPASAASAHSRPDVTYRRVNGLRPTVVVVAHASDRATRHVTSLVNVAKRHAETNGFI